MVTHMNGWDIVDLDFQKFFDNVLTEERFCWKESGHLLRLEEELP